MENRIFARDLIFRLNSGYLTLDRLGRLHFLDLMFAMARPIDIAVTAAPAPAGACDRFVASRLNLSLLLIGPWAA
jgi:hypothetical protein